MNRDPASLHVLVVDDMPDVGAVLQRFLEAEGAAVTTATSGPQAEKFLRHARPIDLAFLDLRMPGWNGVETLDRLRALQPDLRAVFMTGYAGGLEGDLSGCGAEAVLSKPFHFDEVRRVLRDVQANPIDH